MDFASGKGWNDFFGNWRWVYKTPFLNKNRCHVIQATWPNFIPLFMEVTNIAPRLWVYGSRFHSPSQKDHTELPACLFLTWLFVKSSNLGISRPPQNGPRHQVVCIEQSLLSWLNSWGLLTSSVHYFGGVWSLQNGLSVGISTSSSLPTKTHTHNVQLSK